MDIFVERMSSMMCLGVPVVTSTCLVSISKDNHAAGGFGVVDALQSFRQNAMCCMRHFDSGAWCGSYRFYAGPVFDQVLVRVLSLDCWCVIKLVLQAWWPSKSFRSFFLALLGQFLFVLHSG